MEAELVIKKFNGLPINLQKEVDDFIDFLISKHHKVKKSKNEELSEELKAELDRCLDAYKKNPNKMKSFEQIEKEIHARMKYELHN